MDCVTVLACNNFQSVHRARRDPDVEDSWPFGNDEERLFDASDWTFDKLRGSVCNKVRLDVR